MDPPHDFEIIGGIRSAGFEVLLNEWTWTAAVLEAYPKALNYHFVEQGHSKKNGDFDNKWD